KVECRARGRSDEEPEALSVPAVKSGAVTLHGLYRGQRIGARAEATVQRVADTVVTRYPEKGAGLAFYADRSAHEVRLAIVLDASGSMKEQNKFKDALEALRRVLSDPHMPEGAKVSIWLFGEEKTPIRRFLEPTSWSAEKTNDVIENLKGVKPYGRSPIA